MLQNTIFCLEKLDLLVVCNLPEGTVFLHKNIYLRCFEIFYFRFLFCCRIILVCTYVCWALFLMVELNSFVHFSCYSLLCFFLLYSPLCLLELIIFSFLLITGCKLSACTNCIRLIEKFRIFLCCKQACLVFRSTHTKSAFSILVVQS